MKQEEQVSKKRSTKNSLSDYAKYSSLAFQMVAIILAGVFGGQYLDNYFKFTSQVFTLSLSLISIGLAIYIAVKDFIHPK